MYESMTNYDAMMQAHAVTREVNRARAAIANGRRRGYIVPAGAVDSVERASVLSAAAVRSIGADETMPRVEAARALIEAARAECVAAVEAQRQSAN